MKSYNVQNYIRYKQDLKQFKPVKIFDILSAIEALLPNTIKPTYL